MSTSNIDYKALQQRVSLHQAIQYLGLRAVQRNATFRAPCPACQRGGDRALAITPGKGWSCWSAGGQRPGASGLDATSLVAHVKGVKNHDAAVELIRHFAIDGDAIPRSSPSPAPSGVAPPTPLNYLTYTEAVEGLGLTEETCAEWGAGYADRGTMRGRFLVPLRQKDGSYYAIDNKVQYAGLAMKQEQAPRVQLDPKCRPEDIIFGADRITGDEVRLVADVLSVLIASQSGEEAVCFLSESVDPQQLETLAAVLDSKHAKLFF